MGDGVWAKREIGIYSQLLRTRVFYPAWRRQRVVRMIVVLALGVEETVRRREVGAGWLGLWWTGEYCVVASSESWGSMALACAEWWWWYDEMADLTHSCPLSLGKGGDSKWCVLEKCYHRLGCWRVNRWTVAPHMKHTIHDYSERRSWTYAHPIHFTILLPIVRKAACYTCRVY